MIGGVPVGAIVWVLSTPVWGVFTTIAALVAGAAIYAVTPPPLQSSPGKPDPTTCPARPYLAAVARWRPPACGPSHSDLIKKPPLIAFRPILTPASEARTTSPPPQGAGGKVGGPDIHHGTGQPIRRLPPPGRTWEQHRQRTPLPHRHDARSTDGSADGMVRSFTGPAQGLSRSAALGRSSS